MVFSHSLMGAF